MLVIFLLSSFSYFRSYYLAKNLNFTDEDKFLLLLFAVALIGLVIFYLFLVFDRAKVIKILHKIQTQIVEVEDNCILVNRDTQEMIMNYFDKET